MINSRSYSLMKSSYKDNESHYTISQAAKMVGVTVHSLRVYEKEGLIIPKKKPSGHRLYSRNDIERLKSIREMIVVQKLSIAGIKAMFAMIPCWEIIKCTHTDRENCEAYRNDYCPCWSNKHKNTVCAEYDCRECKVYTAYDNVEQVRRLIKDITSE